MALTIMNRQSSAELVTVSDSWDPQQSIDKFKRCTPMYQGTIKAQIGGHGWVSTAFPDTVPKWRIAT